MPGGNVATFFALRSNYIRSPPFLPVLSPRPGFPHALHGPKVLSFVYPTLTHPDEPTES